MGKSSLLCLLLFACGGDESRCDDPKYGDGPCDVETTCGSPDIDCFVTFDAPEPARSWYEASAVRAQKGPSAPSTDARFAAMQALIDEGWEAYQAAHDVGDLASKRVQLVLIDSDVPNAFVIGDGTKAGLVVMVNFGLIDLNAPKEQLMGVVMHELEHAIGLHVVPAVKMRFNRYYSAGATGEPLGFEQADDPAVRTIFEDWDFYAGDVGYLTDVELSGLPVDGAWGDAFQAIVVARQQAQPAACNASVQQLASIYQQIGQLKGPLDGGVTLASTAPMTISTVLTKLRDECFMGVTGDAIKFIAAYYKLDEAQFRASIPAELKMGVEGVNVINGFFTLVGRERLKMREAAAKFMTQTGLPFTRLRYYSTEEAADDSSVTTLDAMGLPPEGIGLLLPKLANIEAQCRPLVDGNQPIPYGEDLTDDHHATCWRAGHVKAAIATLTRARRVPLGPMPSRTPLVPRTDVLFSD